MRTLLFVVPLFFWFAPAVFGQNDAAVLDTIPDFYDQEADSRTLVAPDELKTSEVYQSQQFKVREFDQDEWKKIIDGEDYVEEGRKSELKKQEVSAPWGGKILKVISYLVIGGLLLAVVYYVTRFMSFDSKIERTEFKNEDHAATVEDIREIDIDAMLEQAKRDANYKLAVRLYYLGLLKKLNDKGIVVWKKDKTNRDYLTELLSAGFFFDEVRRLTLSYEAVWYGDHDLRREAFQSLAARFERIYDRIITNDRA